MTEDEYAAAWRSSLAHVAAAKLVGPSRTRAVDAQQFWHDFPISGDDIALARHASDPAPQEVGTG